MLYDKITTYWILFVVLALAICLHFIERGILLNINMLYGVNGAT